MAKSEKGVSKQTAGKMGLVGAVSVIITSVVGIGIFFKNGGVFKLNNGNCIGVLVSWVLSAVIAMFTAFAYIEISTSKKTAGTNAGLGGWAGDFVGYNMGRAVKILMPTWNYGTKCLALAVFAGMAIFNIAFCTRTDAAYGDWYQGNTMLYSTLAGAGLIIFFMFLNYFSSKFGDKFSQMSTIIKFIPILIVISIGVAFGMKNADSGLWKGDIATKTKYSGQFSITGILDSLPAILFAFDGFLIIGNIATKVDNPRKNVSMSIVIAMIVIIALNLAITVGCITCGTGNPFEIFKIAFGIKGVDPETHKIVYTATTLSNVFTILMASLIAFSAIACVNAYAIAGVDALQDCIQDESVMLANYFKQIKGGSNLKLSSTLYYAAFLAIFGIVTSIPTCILNTDQIWDGLTVVSVVVFFAIYGVVIVGGLTNRRTYRTEVERSKLFVPSAYIGCIGCFFIAAYSLLYTYLINMFMVTNGQINAMSTFKGWGLSFTPMYMTGGEMKLPDGSTVLYNGCYFQSWIAATLFWLLAVLNIVYPFINDVILLYTNKTYGHALMWQKEEAQGFSIVNTPAPTLPPLIQKKIKKEEAVA